MSASSTVAMSLLAWWQLWYSPSGIGWPAWKSEYAAM